jgi:putative oxidoreductase
MKVVTIIARTLLGLAFFAAGVMFFLPIKTPPPPTGLAGDFFTAIFASHYLHAVKCFEVVGGFLLLIGKKAPLGLTLIGPVAVNILFYGIFLDHSALAPALVVSVLSLFLLWAYRSAFAGIVKE